MLTIDTVDRGEIIHESISHGDFEHILNSLLNDYNDDRIKYVSPSCASPHNSKYFTKTEYLQDMKQCGDVNNGKESHMDYLCLDGTNYHRSIVKELSYIFNKHSIVLSGQFYYHKGDFLSWHTNMNEPGLRLYITHVPVEGKSFFKYQCEDGPIVTTYDKKGWSYRLFEVTEENPLWHCVYSDTDRLSIGFRIFPNL